MIRLTYPFALAALVLGLYLAFKVPLVVALATLFIATRKPR